ncbi:cytochrome b N-terminal domain-containing protein [Desulfopila aestuarii]
MNSAHTRAKKQFPSDLLLHVHPRTVPVETLRFTLSFGLGGMATTLVLLLFITGILQKVSYIPDIQRAYHSIQFMYTDSNFAGWLRNIHYWSGNMLVIISFLHFCRVFLTGAIAGRRRLNWIVGLFLLGLVFFSNFSGYLLPWDQLAYWAVTIFLNMIGYIPFIGQPLAQLLRGGSEIGTETLTNFYAIHTGLLPFLMLLLVIGHFWLIRKARGLVQQQSGKGPTFSVPVMPNLIVREAAVGLSLIAAILLFSAIVDAPLSGAATPGVSPNPAKAAWFFMGLQELLMHLHPVFAICVFPVIVLFCLLAIPFWQNSALNEGIWFNGERGRKLAIVVSITSITLTIAAVLIDNVATNIIGSPATALFTRGVLPLVIFLSCHCLGYALLTSRYSYTRGETVMAGFLFIVVAMICLTVIGVWFRGPGMQLMFPF